MEKPVTTRLPKEFIIGLKKIAEKENLDTSTIIRKFLAIAIQEWKINHALELYSKGEFSFGQIVDFAGISPWDIPDLLKQKKIPINYDKEELKSDLRTMGWKKK